MEKNTTGHGKKVMHISVLGTGVVIILIAAFFLFQPIFASNDMDKEGAPQAMPAVPVEVRTVELAPSVHEINTVGTLHANESVIIRSEVSGRIIAIEFAEGEEVQKDTPLFKLDQSVLQAELAKAQAELNLHWSDYKRAESLVKNNAISERERDQAYAQWKVDQANVRLIQAQLDKTVIRAPFSGILGLRSVSVGDFVSAGQELVNLEDTSKLKAEFRIPEVNSDLITKGQSVILRSDAFPNAVFESSIYAINPRIDEQGRSLVVRSIMDNADRQLRPGQFVEIAVEVSRRENALFIPEQAVISQTNRQFAWKVENGRAVMTTITLGTRKKGMVEIKAGLQAGDQVITGGHQKVFEGMPVQAIEADPNMFKS